MADAKCRLCSKRPAARTGAQNRTPADRLMAIHAGVCRPCFERVEDAKMFLARDTKLEADDRAIFQQLVDKYNQR
jgi:hypothetical protein